jgi:hypothetical protein
METLSPDQWRALFAESSHSALHLEMRDIYAVEDEKQRIAHFQATGSRDLAAEAEALERSWWLELMRDSKARGVSLRRARIVSEPVTSYIRYEYWDTPLNIIAGEEVRWLPRTLLRRRGQLRSILRERWTRFDVPDLFQDTFTGTYQQRIIVCGKDLLRRRSRIAWRAAVQGLRKWLLRRRGRNVQLGR